MDRLLRWQALPHEVDFVVKCDQWVCEQGGPRRFVRVSLEISSHLPTGQVRRHG
jgi:hypothetical protein